MDKTNINALVQSIECSPDRNLIPLRRAGRREPWERDWPDRRLLWDQPKVPELERPPSCLIKSPKKGLKKGKYTVSFKEL